MTLLRINSYPLAQRAPDDLWEEQRIRLLRLREARAASAVAANAIGGNPEAARENVGAMGPFSDTSTRAEIVEGIDGRPQLVVSVYGKEQVEQGLIGEPALTVIVDTDGEVTLNGPGRASATFDAFFANGWAKVAKGWFGYTRITGATNPQLVRILGDAHARVLAWKGEDAAGLHWKRI